MILKFIRDQAVDVVKASRKIDGTQENSPSEFPMIFRGRGMDIFWNQTMEGGVQTLRIIHKNHCFTILKSREIKKQRRPILLGEKRENFRGSEKMRTSSHQDENERQQKNKVNSQTHSTSVFHKTCN